MSVPGIRLSSSDKKRFDEIRSILTGWYKKNRRAFSWRKEIRDPYEVLVCEVMGQQTQASRIQEFLPRFLGRFPTSRSLASAKQSDVVKQWQGLGYNRRAINLQKTAKQLAGKDFPETEEELLALPGIGKYTARAVLIFAFNKKIGTVDINIQRLLSRLYKKMPDGDTMLPIKDIFTLGEAILPQKDSRLWHEALMDFGAVVCTKRNPQCEGCPLFFRCKSGKVLIDAPAISKKQVVNNEPKYFGYPKRIWRGKVLKMIASNKKISESMLVTALQNPSPKKEFRPFIRTILKVLTDEGFCKRENNIYRLHKG